MRFTPLLFVLSQVLRMASVFNTAFKTYIKNTSARILIKTADGQRARLFIFDKGKVSSRTDDQQNYDAALVWQDSKTAFSVMMDKREDASFNAAADGKLKVLGMSVYARWFEDGIKLVL